MYQVLLGHPTSVKALFQRLLSMRYSFGLTTLALCGLLGVTSVAQAQKTKSAAFSYLPEQGEDRYNQRVPQKTLALASLSWLTRAAAPTLWSVTAPTSKSNGLPRCP
jgi:hypothetical protein